MSSPGSKSSRCGSPRVPLDNRHRRSAAWGRPGMQSEKGREEYRVGAEGMGGNFRVPNKERSKLARGTLLPPILNLLGTRGYLTSREKKPKGDTKKGLSRKGKISRRVAIVFTLTARPDQVRTSSSFQDAFRAGENRRSLFQREPLVPLGVLLRHFVPHRASPGLVVPRHIARCL